MRINYVIKGLLFNFIFASIEGTFFEEERYTPKKPEVNNSYRNNKKLILQSPQKHHHINKTPKPIIEKPHIKRKYIPSHKTKNIKSRKKLKHEKINTTHPLIIYNNIDEQMISYYHWTGIHTPQFSLKVNNIDVPLQGMSEIVIQNSTLVVSYKADFENVIIQDEETTQEHFLVKLNENTRKIIITFDWLQGQRITILEYEK